MAFLKRVCFGRYKKQDDFMLSFENLSELEEEMEMYDRDDTEASNQQKNQPSDTNLCGICVLNERDCVLIPCGHLFFCMECWAKHQSNEAENFSFFDEDGNRIEVPGQFDEPLQNVTQSVQNAIKLHPT